MSATDIAKMDEPQPLTATQEARCSALLIGFAGICMLALCREDRFTILFAEFAPSVLVSAMIAYLFKSRASFLLGILGAWVGFVYVLPMFGVRLTAGGDDFWQDFERLAIFLASTSFVFILMLPIFRIVLDIFTLSQPSRSCDDPESQGAFTLVAAVCAIVIACAVMVHHCLDRVFGGRHRAPSHGVRFDPIR